jgi:hypothetical protein
MTYALWRYVGGAWGHVARIVLGAASGACARERGRRAEGVLSPVADESGEAERVISEGIDGLPHTRE